MAVDEHVASYKMSGKPILRLVVKKNLAMSIASTNKKQLLTSK